MTLEEALFKATLQGSAAIAIAWAVCRIVPAIPPAARLWIWRIAFLKLLISALPLPGIVLACLPAPEAASAPALAARAALGPAHGTTWGAFAGVWLCGILLVLTRSVLTGRRVRNLVRNSTPVTDGRSIAAYRFAAQNIPVGRRPALLESPEVHSPVLVAGRRATIVLPPGFAAAADEDSVRLALSHELAHLRSRDLWWGWLYALAQTVFFFNPIVWLGVRESLRHQEMHADALALRASGADASQYAEMLLSLARKGASTSLRPSMAVGLSAHGASLRDRIRSLYATSHSPRARFAATACCLLAVTAAMPWQLTTKPAPHAASARGGRVLLEQSLHFDVDQQLKMRDIIAEQNRMIGAARTQRDRRMAIWKTNVAIRAMLSPDQQTQFDQLIGHPDKLKP